MVAISVPDAGCVRRALLAGALLLACLRGAGAQTPLLLVTEHTPPDIMREGDSVRGISGDKVRIMLERADIPHRFQVLAWRRAYMLAQKDPDTCVFSTARIPEREALFKWVGPLREADWTLYGLASTRRQLKSLEDARGLRIGGYNGDVRATYLQARGFTVDTAQDDLTNPRKLLAGHIDLWAAGSEVARLAIEQNGWSGKIVPLLVFHSTKLYLACNRSVPDQRIAAMNAALTDMQRDGTVAAIERRYANWRPQAAPPER